MDNRLREKGGGTLGEGEGGEASRKHEDKESIGERGRSIQMLAVEGSDIGVALTFHLVTFNCERQKRR